MLKGTQSTCLGKFPDRCPIGGLNGTQAAHRVKIVVGRTQTLFSSRNGFDLARPWHYSLTNRNTNCLASTKDLPSRSEEPQRRCPQGRLGHRRLGRHRPRHRGETRPDGFAAVVHDAGNADRARGRGADQSRRRSSHLRVAHSTPPTNSSAVGDPRELDVPGLLESTYGMSGHASPLPPDRTGVIGEGRLRPPDEPGRGFPLRPPDWWKLLPFEADASSDRLGWAGLAAARFRAAPASELQPPAMSHHRLILLTRPPERLEILYGGVTRRLPPPAGSIILVPAGIPARYRWSGRMDALNIYLDPTLVARVAEEAFEVDPTRWELPPLDGLDLPPLQAVMGAVDAELSAGDAGGALAAESLANVLAVRLLRHVMAPRRPTRSRDGVLPRGRLRSVIEYIEEHLDTAPTLADMAAVARVSPYHFARQFRAATGLPPHRYLIMRRVERAKELLRCGEEVSLAQVATRAGFSDQSQLTRHFRRLVGVTPGQFRSPATID